MRVVDLPSSRRAVVDEEFRGRALFLTFMFFDSLDSVKEFAGEDFGFITAEDVQGVTGELTKQDIFICGPPVMIRNLRQQFAARGIDLIGLNVDTEPEANIKGFMGPSRD